MIGSFLTSIWIILGLAAVEIATDQKTVSFKQITVPPSMAAVGYNPDVVGRRIRSEAQVIVRNGRGEEPERRFAGSETRDSLAVLAHTLGASALLTVAEQAVGGVEFVISVAVVEENGGLVLRMTAARADGRVVRSRVHGSKDDIVGLLSNAGQALVRLVEPHFACMAKLRAAAKVTPFDPSDAVSCVDASVGYAEAEDKVFLHNIKGIALAAAGDEQGALEAFRAAVQLDPRMASGLINAGLVMAKQGRYDDAARTFSKATIRTTSSTPQMRSAAYAMWAMSVEASGTSPEAVLHLLRHAVRTDPSYRAPQELLLARLPAESAEAGALRKAIAWRDAEIGTWSKEGAETLAGNFPAVADKVFARVAGN